MLLLNPSFLLQTRKVQGNWSSQGVVKSNPIGPVINSNKSSDNNPSLNIKSKHLLTDCAVYSLEPAAVKIFCEIPYLSPLGWSMRDLNISNESMTINQTQALYLLYTLTQFCHSKPKLILFFFKVILLVTAFKLYIIPNTLTAEVKKLRKFSQNQHIKEKKGTTS